MDINPNSYLAFLLVMLRLTGMLVFNPIFGRKNVPVLVNTGLAFFIALAVMPSLKIPDFANVTLIGMVVSAAFELSVGAIVGLILNMISSIFVIGGDIIDMNIGISMSKAFDPANNMQTSLTTGMMNALFILIFFVTNNHFTLINMVIQTFNIIPAGTASINPDVFYYLNQFLSSIFVYAIKLALPITILEIVMTMGTGIIMRVVPQINVFVVNIQVKLLVGIAALFVLIPSFTGFIENIIVIGFERIGEAFIIMAG